MTRQEMAIYATRLASWYVEGCNISCAVDEDNDSFEIEIVDTNDITTWQEFNLYQGRQIWAIYFKMLEQIKKEQE